MMTNDPISEHFDSPSMRGNEPVQGPHIKEDLPQRKPSDPRMSKEYTQSILNESRRTPMHMNPQSDILQENETPIYGSLTNLIDRLEHVYSYTASLDEQLANLNDKLGGSSPQETTGAKSPSKPNSCLGIAHTLVSDIEHRLHLLENGVKRLYNNIGE